MELKVHDLQVRPGNDSEVVEVLRQSKAVWGAGIGLEDYVRYHSLIREHPWSQGHFQHLILTDAADEIFSSCKIYRHRARIDEREYGLAVIGAIFTPPHDRGLGYASQMLEQVLDLLADRGADLVMLFSDIGAEFYTRFGFRLALKQDPIYAFMEKGIAPAEIAFHNHLPEQAWEWDRTFERRQRFCLVRSPEYYSLLSERIAWHQQYLGFKDQKVIVSFADQSFLWADLSRWRTVVRKFGTAAPDPEAALGCLLSALRQKLGFHDFTGWLPREFEQYRFLKLKEKEPRSRTLMMVSALSEPGRIIYSLPPEQIQFWLGDYF